MLARSWNGFTTISPHSARPGGPGFRKIIIKRIVGDLTWVKGRYDSAHGCISSA